jgi:DNA repair protein RecN (Recombination protein N)
MLQSLHIEHVAVIRQADIEFDPGLCVLTGETGAGKSLLIDSINALTGARMSRELIRTGEDKALVSAVFTDLNGRVVQALSDMGLEVSAEDGALMLQRQLYRDGRSTARINGRAVTQSLLREAGALLINIHGQSDNQKLMQKAAHLSLLDDFAGNEGPVAEYRQVYSRWKAANDRLDGLRQDEAERLRTREMLEFQIKDIDAARLKVGEEERLTERRDFLLHQEKINRQVRLAARALREGEKATVITLLDRAEGALSQVADILPGADDLVARLQSVRYEAEDIAERVCALGDEEVADPVAELDKLEGRLDTITRLGRKYGAGVAEILAFREKAAARLAELDSADLRIAEYEAESARWQTELRRLSASLTERRRAAAVDLSGQVQESLAFLDMPKVRFQVSVRSAGRMGPDGGDDVEFLIATNPGEPLQSLIRIASGGELSRIMLAIRSVLNERYGVGTSIYDEVDAGISGRTARKVGIKLCRMSSPTDCRRPEQPAKEGVPSSGWPASALPEKGIAGSQVICVTHSAQIASLADAHYVIRKTEVDGRAETTVERLSEEERVDEVARILGGLELTEAQRAAARDLIAERQTIRNM